MVSILDALSDGAAQVHDNVPGNDYGHLEIGDKDATNNAFEAAATIVDIEIINNRLAPTAMETRACNMAWDGTTLTIYQGYQGVHSLRDRIAGSIDLDPKPPI